MKSLSLCFCFATFGTLAMACGDDSPPVGGSPASGGGGSGPVAGSPPSNGGGGSGQGGEGGSGEGGEGGSGGSPVECVADDGTILAVERLFMGDTDWNGSQAADAWENFGRDIDGVVTTNDFSGHCLPNSGASPNNVFPDGPNGLDNAFGKVVVPILLTASQGDGVSEPATMAIHMGGSTLVFDMIGLGGADQDPVETRLYGSSELGMAANFDGEDCWPVAENSLTNPADITTATTVFDAAVVAGDVWSSGPPVTLDVAFSAQGIAVPLRLYQAQITMRLNAAHDAATQGQISGVIDTAEFNATLADVIGAFDPSLCNGAVLQAIQNQIAQASDIMVDGSQDPGMTCDGISIGLGFEASAVHLGGVGPGLLPPDTCP